MEGGPRIGVRGRLFDCAQGERGGLPMDSGFRRNEGSGDTRLKGGNDGGRG